MRRNTTYAIKLRGISLDEFSNAFSFIITYQYRRRLKSIFAHRHHQDTGNPCFLFIDHPPAEHQASFVKMGVASAVLLILITILCRLSSCYHQSWKSKLISISQSLPSVSMQLLDVE
jgi:hypothetical protein